jgi:creatinine amidohydrolase
VSAVAGATVLIVPMGSTEQHGPHLPLGTDTIVAAALCERVASVLAGVVVAPALPYGSSGEHAGFVGTLSIGADALEHVVVELVRSADAFAGVVLVSGHGGNAVPLRRAVARLRSEGRRALAWSPSVPGGDAHAGRTETSLLLALSPSDVALEWAEPGNTASLEDLLPLMQEDGVAGVSSNGVLGDPTGASAEEGQALLDQLTRSLYKAVVEAIEGWRGS